MEKYFRFLARAVPHNSLITNGGDAETMPIFTQFSKEELDQIDARGLGLSIDHTGGDIFGYVVDKFASDNNCCLVMIEIPPQNGVADEKIEQNIRSTQENFKKMIKSGFTPDVSLSHRPQYIYDADTNTMDITKYLQEISITTQGGREGSAILEWHESDEPYNPEIFEKRRTEINAEYVSGASNVEGIEYLEDGTRIVKNKGMCKSMVQVSPAEISTFPPIIQANIKKFSSISSGKEKLLESGKKHTEMATTPTQPAATNTTTTTTSSSTAGMTKATPDDLSAITRKLEEANKSILLLKAKADAYDKLTKESEEAANKETLKTYEDAYADALKMAEDLQKERDEIRKSIAATSAQTGTPAIDTLSKEVDDEISVIAETLKQRGEETRKIVTDTFDNNIVDPLVVNHQKMQDIATHNSYPLAAFSKLRKLTSTTEKEKLPMMMAMRNIAEASNNLGKTMAIVNANSLGAGANIPASSTTTTTSVPLPVKQEKRKFLSFTAQTQQALEAKRQKQVADAADLPKQ